MRQKTKNPQPLDLEDLKEFAPNELVKAIMSQMIYGLYKEEKLVDTKEEAIELAQDLLTEILDEIKQRLKSACEFYLRYKDKPALLAKEIPKYKKEIEKFGEKEVLSPVLHRTYEWDFKKYNEWLFCLAFKGVMRDGN